MSDRHTDSHESWSVIDTIAKGADKWFEQKRRVIETPENIGRYVAIDSDTGEFVIGADEDEAERNFIATYGSERKAVLIHIGRY